MGAGHFLEAAVFACADDEAGVEGTAGDDELIRHWGSPRRWYSGEWGWANGWGRRPQEAKRYEVVSTSFFVGRWLPGSLRCVAGAPQTARKKKPATSVGMTENEKRSGHLKVTATRSTRQ